MARARILRSNVLSKVAAVTGDRQNVPSALAETLVPVLVMNDSSEPVLTSAGAPTGDTEVINSDTTNATILDVKIKDDGDERAVIRFGNARAGTSFTAAVDAVLYTVTVGKTFYLTHLYVANGAGAQGVSLTASGTAIGGFRASTGEMTSNLTFPTPIKFTTAQTVGITANSTDTFWYFGGGWEE